MKVETTDGLSLLGGDTGGPVTDGSFTTTLTFLPTALGWARADVTVEQVGADGTVIGYDTNSVFFLFEERDVWVSTSSDVDLRLKRLAALGGGTGAAGAAALGSASGSTTESVDNIIGSFAEESDTALPEEPMTPEEQKLQQLLGDTAEEPIAKEAAPISEEARSITVKGRILWTDKAGNTHGLPQATVQIWEEDPISADDLLATVSTNAAGDYSASITADDGIGGGGPDVYIRVLSQSAAALIHAPGVADPYFMQSTTTDDVADGATVVKNLTANNSATNQNVFSVHHALVIAGTYAGQLNGTMPSRIETIYPTTDATFSFFRPSPQQLHIALKGPAVGNLTAHAWDVIHHEYGHYFQAVAGFVDSPGGSHTFNVNLTTYDGGRTKDQAGGLAWSEGWATFFGISGQVALGTSALGIPTVGNTSYEAPYNGLNVNIETGPGKGEDDELSVASGLFDLFDNQRDGLDEVAIPDRTLFQAFKSNAAKRMGAGWDAVAKGRSNQEKTLIGAALGQNEINPILVAPADGYTANAAAPPTFRWNRNGGGTPNPLNDWIITFYKADLNTEILSISDQARFTQAGDDASFTPTADEWSTILAGDGLIKWVVKGKNTAATETPGGTLERYWSNARTIGGVNIAMVIDDTGSMGDEIDGVKSGLQAFIDGLRAREGTPPTIQLITFKDNVTVRITSNDLDAVSAAVASLFASGGGDCPEYGAHALQLASQNVSAGGTVLFATDASPQPGVDLGQVIATLRAKGVAVNTILSGDCAGGIEPGGSQLPYAGDQEETVAGAPEPGDGASDPLDPITDAGQPPIDDHSDTRDGATVLLVDGPPTSGQIGTAVAGSDTDDLIDYFQVSLEAGTTYSVVPAVYGGYVSSLIFQDADGNNIQYLNTTTASLVTPVETGIYYLQVNGYTGYPTNYSMQVAIDPLAGLASSALDIFSTISSLTGGAFVVNTNGRTPEYSAAVRNVIESSVSPSVVAASPSKLPQGTNFTLQLRGGKTNWREGATVAFSGTGITTGEVFVESATSLTVDVTIAGDAELGFRDVTVTTPLGEGTEEAVGISVVEVTSPSSSPQLVNVTPPTVSRGATLDLTVNGVNTSFDADSTPTFGSGITVNGTTLVSATRLISNVTVDPTADIGFRTTQVDGLSLLRSILVDVGAVGLPVIAGVTPNAGKAGQTLDVVISGADTNFVDGETTADFGSGITVNGVSVDGPTTATANITIAGDALVGFRTVTVTTGAQTASLPNAFFVDLSVVRITNGPGSVTNPVASAGTTDVYVDAVGPSGQTVSYAWWSDCGDLGDNGYYSDQSAEDPTWTAPVNRTGATLNCSLGVIVSSTGTEETATDSFTQQVFVEPSSVSISEGPSTDTNPVYPGGQTFLSVGVDSNWTVPVQYSWTASCPGGNNGGFSDPAAAVTLWTPPPVGSTTTCDIQVVAFVPGGDDDIGHVSQTVEPVPSTGVQIYANVLPSSRSVRIGTPATAFASIVNDGSATAANCTIAPTTDIPAAFTFQRTDPETNMAVGAQGQPANILPGGAETFVIGLTPSAEINSQEVQFAFDCANSDPAPSVVGLNSLLLSASTGNEADIIAIIASPSNDGIARVPGPSGTGFFTVAGINIGNGRAVTVRPVANAGVPVSLSICETTGTADGSCLAVPGGSTRTTFLPNALKTYTVFVEGNGTPIPMDLANSRVTVRFTTSDGVVRGATSIAVQTGAPGSLLALQ